MAAENGISITELMSHLKISRSFIAHKITNFVKHVEDSPSKGSLVKYDNQALREYLASICTFTRQTKRINLKDEIRDYISKHPDDKRIKEPDFKERFIGIIPDWKKVPRSSIPACNIPSEDFWDYDILFPKDFPSRELFYREMFRKGAIKISIGKQKTMFFIPNKETFPTKLTSYDDENYFLVPADWKPFYNI